MVFYECLCIIVSANVVPQNQTTYLLMFILTQQPSVANHFLAELRDVDVQQDRMKFRRNLERMGELLAYEISK